MAGMEYLTGSGVSVNLFGDDMESLQDAARAVAEEAMRRCLELCGDGHSAPGARADSLFQSGLDKIVSAGAADACGRMTMLNQDETVQYRDTLCAVHSTVEEAAVALLEKAA